MAVAAVLVGSSLSTLAVPAPAAQADSSAAASQPGQFNGWGSNGYGQASVPPALAGKSVTAVAAGNYHSLALTSEGQVVAWGFNGWGQTNVPASLTGKTVTAIAAGPHHSLALASDGQVTAWGINREGQTSVPASLTGKTVTAIAAGDQHSLALTSDGRVTAWGDDGGSLNAPPSSLDGKTVTAIAAGGAHSLALTADGQVTAWGGNSSGEATVPASLTGRTVTAIASGTFHSLALTADGQVTAWGSNSSGQTSIPESLSGKTVTAIAASYGYSLAVTADNQIVMWGTDQGQFTVPASVTGRKVTAIAAGYGHVLAVTAALTAQGTPVVSGVAQANGTLTAVAGSYNAAPDSLTYQWRAGSSVVGSNSPVYRPISADIGKTLTVTVTAKKAGYADAVTTSASTGAVTAGGRVRAWGSNFAGESSVPTSLARTTVTAIAAGFSHTLALTANRKVAAWGAGTQGTVPTGVAAQTVAAIAAGTNHNLALATDGRVLAWGNNGNGQTAVPASLDGRTVIAVAAGNAHSLALTADGQVTAWGSNASGQRDVPAELTGKLVVAIAAGSNHSLALTSEGQVVAWGDNARGQSTVPATLSSKTAIAIAGGSTHSVALTTDGKVTAWGGDTTLNQAVVPASLATKTVIAIATGAGSDHTLAMTSDRQIVGWGSNANGARTIPTSLNGQPNTAIAAGGTHSLALTAAVIADQAPAISGTPAVGSTLSAQVSDYNVNADSYGLQWYADDVAIPDAIYLDYTPTAAEHGKTITVTVTVTKSGHADAVDTSAGVGPVDVGAFTAGPDATVTGTPVVGGTLTASPGPGQLGSTTPAAELFTYAWAADGTAITGATAQTLELTPALVGKTITVKVTASRDGYADAADTSAPTEAVAKATFVSGPTATVSGTPVVGGTLTAGTGTTTPPATSFTYAWTADGDVLSGETGSTLDLTPALVGKTIRVTVTASRDGYADATGTSSPTAAVAKATFTTGPAASITGTPVVGGTLTAGTGTTSPAADSFAYAWAADGDTLAGQTSSNLTLTPALVGKVIRVTVTASRSGYTDAADTSAPTAAVAKATFTTGPAATISGTPVVGGTLTAGTGTTSPAADSFTYAWAADGDTLTGQNGSTLSITPAMVGKVITVTVTAVRAGYVDASDESDPTAKVAQAAFVTGPTASITGTPVVGGTLTAGTGTTTPAADSFTYAWAADGTTLTGETASTLVLTPALSGKVITVTVTGVRTGYVDASDESDPTAKVAQAAFVTGPTATVTGTPVVGGTLTAGTGTTTPAADSFTYAWAADGTAITGATHRTLELTPATVGKTITVTVTAHRVGHADAASTSTPTVAVARASFTTGPQATISGTAQVGRTLTAGTGTTSPDAASYGFAWFADGTPIAAATSPTLVLTPDLQGRTITTSVTATRPGFADASSLSAPTAPVASEFAPSVQLRVEVPKTSQDAAQTPDGQPTAQRGGTVTVRWVAENADTLVAGGQLAELIQSRFGDQPIPATGMVRVRLDRAGAYTYRLRASNETGTTTATAGIVAVRPPTRLTVAAPNAIRGSQIQDGKKIRIQVTGLSYRERYYVTVSYAGTTTRVATGRANTTGTLSRRIALPAKLDASTSDIRIRVTGRSTKRVGVKRILVR